MYIGKIRIKVMSHDIFSSLNKNLKDQHIPPRVLLDKLRLISENSRKSSQYQDPNHLPFYYHLAKYVFPKKIVHVGLDLGLPSCCFLQGSKSTESILCFQKQNQEFYSPRLAISNIRDVSKKLEIDYYYGNANDLNFIKKLEKNFDLFMITENCSNDDLNEFLDIFWQYLNLDGFILVDYVKSEKTKLEIFKSFCKGKNRDHKEFDTRYGIGLVQK